MTGIVILVVLLYALLICWWICEEYTVAHRLRGNVLNVLLKCFVCRPGASKMFLVWLWFGRGCANQIRY